MEYCLEKDVSYKILLIVGNAPRHLSYSGVFHPIVTVVFPSPNTISLMRPMGQGVTAAFKACYLKRTFTPLPRLLLHPRKTPMQLHVCIKIIEWVWGNVTREDMKGVWKKALKSFIPDFKEFAKDEEVAKINEAVVEMANKADDFNLGVDEDDIEGFRRWSRVTD
uniref:DDE-1 domain-containing protein n=1 Tax=Molossus molossus TaxID=27622 RepID=A0A7J8E2F7_MOLMO|nr:hypothetical protein HJG59_009029 [Molossus molossus]